MSGTYATATKTNSQSYWANGLSVGIGSPWMVLPVKVAANDQVHKTVRIADPIAAGTTTATIGTRRPRRPGIQRGNTSPQRAISPMAKNAIPSVTNDRTTGYKSAGNHCGRSPLAPEPPAGSSASGIVAIRQTPLGSTTNGIASAAMRAHRGTPSTASCADFHARRIRPLGEGVRVAAGAKSDMHRASQRPGPGGSFAETKRLPREREALSGPSTAPRKRLVANSLPRRGLSRTPRSTDAP